MKHFNKYIKKMLSRYTFIEQFINYIFLIKINFNTIFVN